ncbi:MAG: helix-turn-helix domain-containing protein [Solirubrobacteraceae bacterium]
MTNNQRIPISITLSPAQIDEVVRAASNSRAPSVSTLIGGYLPVDEGDPRLSRSLLRGLSLLTCFGADGAERGIIDMAGYLGMSPSTTHRYASTLVELGLLERCPRTRKYRLPGTRLPVGD